MTSTGSWILAAALALTPAAAGAEAEKPASPESRAALERQGIGLRAGGWWPQGLAEQPDASYARTPWLEGYYQKGLDLHLSLETAAGFWHRSQEVTRTDLFGNTSRQTLDTYLVPLFTSLRLHPLTGPEADLEPYLAGGIGVALGVDDRSGNQDLLGAGTGPTASAGFGFRLAAGIDWRFAGPFGLSAGARYQWIRFLEPMGGERFYRGFEVDLGLGYRFQYR